MFESLAVWAAPNALQGREANPCTEAQGCYHEEQEGTREAENNQEEFHAFPTLGPRALREAFLATLLDYAR